MQKTTDQRRPACCSWNVQIVAVQRFLNAPKSSLGVDCWILLVAIPKGLGFRV